jgi:DNA-binding response OmpR family regulator
MSCGNLTALIPALFKKAAEQAPGMFGDTQSSESEEPHTAHYLGTAMTDKIKILIVEGDMPLAMTMVSLLTRVGCNVSAACTGEKGMALAVEKTFDLIALNVDLPDINEICCELKQRHFSRHTPIVFISNHATIEDQQDGLNFGAADYITKPFDASDFVSRILSHINHTTVHA